eukprot:SAG22_NODE_2_length_61565_cov_858.782010_29_plen_83_part_00
MPDITVHMDTPADICFARLQKRNQVGDTGVSRDYLELLDEKYSYVYSKLKSNDNYYYIKHQPNHSVDDLLNSIDESQLGPNT